MATRMAFVESIDRPPAPADGQASPASATEAQHPAEAGPPLEAEDPSPKKFSKKY